MRRTGIYSRVVCVKTRTSEVRASECFTQTTSEYTPYKALSMMFSLYYIYNKNSHTKKLYWSALIEQIQARANLSLPIALDCKLNNNRNKINIIWSKFCNEWIKIRTKHFLFRNLFIIYIARISKQHAILRNKWIKIVQANQPWSCLFIL